MCSHASGHCFSPGRYAQLVGNKVNLLAGFKLTDRHMPMGKKKKKKKKKIKFAKRKSHTVAQAAPSGDDCWNAGDGVRLPSRQFSLGPLRPRGADVVRSAPERSSASANAAGR